MEKDLFPEPQIVFKDKPYTPEFFALTLDEIDKTGESFIGILRVDEADRIYFLFFLKGDAYAAGYIKNDKSLPLSIKDFLEHMASSVKERKLSLYRTDAALMKGMLVFLQKEPSIKAATSLINLEDILNKIKNDNASTFIVLRKNNKHNFFYIHSGEPMVAHFADSNDAKEGNSILEQMLFYAYSTDKNPVEAIVYLDIKTWEASDVDKIKLLLRPDMMLQRQEQTDKTELPRPTPSIAQDLKPKDDKSREIIINVIDGQQKGESFDAFLPVTLGRKGADILIKDITVSKIHVLIEASGSRVIFKDLKSTNGSMVNRKMVDEIELSDGDIINIGNTTLKISF